MKKSLIAIAALCLALVSCTAKGTQYDVVVYGSSPSGITAAVEAVKSGKSAVLIVPSIRLGGMPASGLGETDFGKSSTVQGFTRNVFERIGAKYGKDIAWRFEPKVANQVFKEIVEEFNIPLFMDEYLDLEKGVKMSGKKIVSITMESGREFKGKMFVDASYESDIMAKAGVTYMVGRESNSVYNEKGNGIRVHDKQINEMPYGVSPYIKADDPFSDLLPRTYVGAGGASGEGDGKVPAYCYRVCLTNDPDNMIPVGKPLEYDSMEYEMLLRALALGMPKDRCFKLSPMPNKKTDSNNHSGISMDYNGGNWDYPEANHERRKQIAKAHEIYQKGFIWTVQNHPRTPQAVKDYYAGYGLPKDEFLENGHWPVQLYVREARRMISDYVVTEHDCRRERISDRSIALGSYSMDSHNMQYVINSDGYANTEGGYFWKLKKAFPIDYRIVVPKKGECSNLFVTIGCSCSHAAYGSVRQEPCYMMLGQACGAAACLSIDNRVAVQDLDYAILKEKLLAGGMLLEDPDDKPFSVNAPGSY